MENQSSQYATEYEILDPVSYTHLDCKGNSGRYTGGKAALRDSGRRGCGRGRFRAGLSAAEEAPLLRVSENHSPSARQNQYLSLIHI